ncbi:MAG: acyl carrier protein [Solidesulfovibrio magneticus str. Maddingley MBC34]|uniref:Acyl carrier protein n=1 Tax=Solidesulfovibrio magneticus str. Maddingley MBC34 TaxID=1206767 RepID=K6FJ97_9BACT|nr:MAG: acyl carrier protein [Solidesulfovibrio magneticus str. Maddingley MBC34]
MAVTKAALKELLILAGVERAVVDALPSDAPMLRHGIDSLDFPSFIVVLEEHFGLTIPEAEAWELRTLDDFAAYLDARAPKA